MKLLLSTNDNKMIVEFMVHDGMYKYENDSLDLSRSENIQYLINELLANVIRHNKNEQEYNNAVCEMIREDQSSAVEL